MHSLDDKHSGITIFHHGDYSGDVTICMPKDRVELTEFGGLDRYEVSVPMTLLRELVAEQLRSAAIEKLEELSVDALLKRVIK